MTQSSERMALRAFYHHDYDKQELVFTWPASLAKVMPSRMFVGPVPKLPEFGNPEHCALFEKLNRRLGDIHSLACIRANAEVEMLDSPTDQADASGKSEQLDLF